MKILLATDEYINQINGVTNSVVALKNELTKLGHDVRVLTLSPNNKSYVKDNDYYISSIHVPIYPDARYSFRKHDKLLKNIIEWSPDLVHIQTEYSARVLANKIIKKLNIPYIITCHAMYEDYIRYWCPSKKLGKFIIKKLSNKYYNPSKALVVPSIKLKKKEIEYGVKCPIEVIPTGIDLEKFNNRISLEERKKLLKKYNIDIDKKVLVTVSRVAVEKNIEEIINYFKLLLEKDSNYRLLIVGDGPDKKSLENLVDKLELNEYVKFTGMIMPDEVYKYYQLGDVFVCASTSESQGLTYVEALASSLPLVCRKDDCLLDVIEVGKNGFVYENHGDFVDSILKANKNMGKKSLEISKKYRKEEFGRTIEKLYKEILGVEK